MIDEVLTSGDCDLLTVLVLGFALLLLTQIPIGFENLLVFGLGARMVMNGNYGVDLRMPSGSPTSPSRRSSAIIRRPAAPTPMSRSTTSATWRRASSCAT